VAGRGWVIARAADESELIPAAQLVDGHLEQATRRLRAGGWVALSEAIADRLGATIGESVTLPTPSGPARWRLAATVTNFGWAPGAVVLNADDYGSQWRTGVVAALEVDLAPGVDPEDGAGAVERALGPASSLTVETAAERAERFRRLARQGLDRLSQIFALLLVAAVLALAAATVGVLWQRRPRLAALKAQGFPDGQVWRALLLETGILLGSGCLIGGAFDLYGQAVGVRWLEAGTGFPIHYSVAAPLALAIMLGVALFATAVTGLPGYIAARVPPAVGFQEGLPRSS
jgi:putative ABC transport system permease protein